MRAIAIVLFSLVACSGPDSGLDSDTGVDTDTDTVDVAPTAIPTVTVHGMFSLLVGESTALTARTTNGEDSGYVWSSSDPTVVVVQDGGSVRALSVGRATVTATGLDTDAIGELGVVVSVDTPYRDDWAHSAHAQVDAEAFTHWNEDGEVPASCARCHTTTGLQDYIGADGSAPDAVDSAHPAGQVVSCTGCHNPVADNLSHVVFPSGVVVDDLGGDARCMTCHQGRSSTDTVDASIAAAGVGDDEISAELSFSNIHYYAAGATLLAGQVRGAYQYADQVYDWRFRHVPGVQGCTDCHDSHSLQVRVDLCVTCHAGATDITSLRNIRMLPSRDRDYNGNGNTTEGIYFEVRGLQVELIDAIGRYSQQHASTGVCYNTAAYPYWFEDDNGSGGQCDAGESTAFTEWTPRLLRGAYNYQVALKDPGSWAHNGKYTIEVLHDSITDLSSATADPVDTSDLVRTNTGHFNGASNAARNWDSGETVRDSCSRCHGGAEGFRFYTTFGATATVDRPDNGLECATCHDDFQAFSVVDVPVTRFPGGAEVALAGDHSNVCGTCHAGRESKASVDAAIASGQLAFKNVHYLPAAAVRAGSSSGVGYEYDDRTYSGAWNSHPGGSGCVDCHLVTSTSHSFNVNDNFAQCTLCHLDATVPHDIRASARSTSDYDGDGSTTEPLAGEVEGLLDRLMTAMQTEATDRGQPICRGDSYPYFFKDTSGDDVCQPGEQAYSNAYTAWTPALMKASFNHQLATEEPGAWAHNFNYIGQLLYDSIEDLEGTAPSGLRRP